MIKLRNIDFNIIAGLRHLSCVNVKRKRLSLVITNIRERGYLFTAFMLALASNTAFAHGFIGKRFFPAAISQDEPFIADKIALPIFYSQAPDNVWTLNPKLQYAKTITPYFQASASASYLSIHNSNDSTHNGFANWLVGVRYNVFKSPVAESMFSVAINSDIGGTGSQVVNTASNTTVSPEILFAQGFGPLPDNLKLLRPLGFSISAEPNIITTNYTVTSVSLGLTLEYSLPYLTQYVTAVNSSIADHLVPIIEFPFTVCTQHCSAKTTGTIDPGIIVYGQYGQVGLEALIPANSSTGSKVGAVAQFYLYLDRLYPNGIGKPFFS